MNEMIWFAAGCLLINGAMDYLSLDFLLRTRAETAFVHQDTRRVYPVPPMEKQADSAPSFLQTILWLALGNLLTLLSLYLRFPGMLPVHMLFLWIFAKTALHFTRTNAIAPVTILFTLYTFAEGISAALMSWCSANIDLPFSGIYLQLSLSLALAFLFFLALHFIRNTWGSVLCRPLSSCLYLLLLPCALMVFLIRCGLRLDSSSFEKYLSVFGPSATLTALLGISVAIILFFLTLHVFCKIICLTEREQAAQLLAVQLQGQQTYIDEARKRNEQYVSFRHDLDNHLLVVSGLLDEQKYEAAKSYAHSLRKNSLPLSVPVATGRAALDILLNEKLSHAKRNAIRTVCRVQIPQDMRLDDMDLCVIFSNILDNAINACRDADTPDKTLSVSTKIRSGFLLIESVNTASPRQNLKPGTGLRNIRNMAKKYRGSVEITDSDGRFHISVLLCPSTGPDHPANTG